MRKKKTSCNFLMCGGNIPLVSSIVVLVAFIFGLLLGSIVMARSVGGPVSLISSMTGSYADGYNAAKKKLADSGLVPALPKGVLNGQIAKINGNEVSFTSALANPLDDEALKNRVAVVDSNTTITLYRQKSAEKLAADQQAAQTEISALQATLNDERMKLSKCNGSSPANCQSLNQEYNDNLQKFNTAEALTDVFEKVDNAALGDLKEGMQISVSGREIKTEGQAAPGANLEDISTQLKFTAGSIIAREVTAPPAPGK
ncbi:MAG TPA: hypothetical protein VMD74_04720 [Candidatus Methylomirabilis sp.]|nr:hypothetical protein [Candidatus Methylomirabilis sp.]